VQKGLFEGDIIVSVFALSNIFSAFYRNTEQALQYPVADGVFEEAIVGEEKRLLTDVNTGIEHIHEGTRVIDHQNGGAVKFKVLTA
jgi:hypothetical protein